jgi:hypothetical protein
MSVLGEAVLGEVVVSAALDELSVVPVAGCDGIAVVSLDDGAPLVPVLCSVDWPGPGLGLVALSLVPIWA